MSGFHSAKYLLSPGSDLCNSTTTPTLVSAAKEIATSFGVQWDRATTLQSQPYGHPNCRHCNHFGIDFTKVVTHTSHDLRPLNSPNLASSLKFCGSEPAAATHRPLSSSFLGFIFRILSGNPKKELLRGLWEGRCAGFPCARARIPCGTCAGTTRRKLLFRCPKP